MNSVSSNLLIDHDFSQVVCPVSRYKYLDLNIREHITGKTYEELIAIKVSLNLPYILAVVQDDNGQNTFNFDAINLRRWIKITPNEPLNPLNFRNLDKIFYFTLHQVDTGYMSCYLGNSTEVDERKLYIDLFFKAAENDIEAQFELGKAHDTGFGADLDKDKAFKYFRLAAKKGHAEAQFYYAFCFYNGEGVEADFEKAQKWWKRSADQGDPDAKEALSDCTRKDFVEAQFSELKLAADNGDAQSQYDLAMEYYDVQPDDDCDETKILDKLAFEYLKLAADQDYTGAIFNLGHCYFEGLGVKPNYEEARKWWQQAADHGDTSAIYFLKRYETKDQFIEHHNKAFFDEIKALSLVTEDAALTFFLSKVDKVAWLQEIKDDYDHFNGDPSIKNLMFLASVGLTDSLAELGDYYSEKDDEIERSQKAIRCWSLAAEEGDPTSLFNLGIAYFDGIIVEKNVDLAHGCFLQVADEFGDVDAMFNVAKLYGEFYLNPEESAYWYLKAAELGDIDAQYNIGCYYFEGHGVEKDLEKAIHWWTAAALAGDKDAQDCLISLTKK